MPGLRHRIFDAGNVCVQIEYNGKTLRVENLEHFICSNCSAQPILSDQIKRNQIRYADARKTADGLLKSNEIRSARASLGISQADASELFGGGPNGFSKYERGEVAQSIAMDRLLRLVTAYPMLLNNLRLYAGLPSIAVSANDYVFETEKSESNWRPGHRRLRLIYCRPTRKVDEWQLADAV